MKDLLTQEFLNKNSIKVQLTQNDLLEVLVEERYREIEGMVTKLHNNYVSLSERREQYYSCKKLILETLGISNVTNFTINGGTITSLNIFDCKIMDVGRGTQNINLYDCHAHNYFDILKDKVLFYIKYGKGTSKSLTTYNIIEGQISTEMISKKLLNIYKKERQSFQKELDAHNAKVEEFVNSYKDVNVNRDSILKQMRVAMNKKVINTEAPELAKEIKRLKENKQL